MPSSTSLRATAWPASEVPSLIFLRQRQPVAIARVEVGNSDVEGLELRLQPQLSLRGQVRIEGAGEGAITSPGSLHAYATQSGGGGYARATPGEDGSFEIASLMPARHRL